jgi:hypothetical protein
MKCFAYMGSFSTMDFCVVATEALFPGTDLKLVYQLGSS